VFVIGIAHLQLSMEHVAARPSQDGAHKFGALVMTG
jgi:hypothetical protein